MSISTVFRAGGAIGSVVLSLASASLANAAASTEGSDPGKAKQRELLAEIQKNEDIAKAAKEQNKNLVQGIVGFVREVIQRQ